MRRMLVAVLVLCALPAFANDRMRISVFFSNPQFTHSDAAGTDWTGGVGAGFEYRWTPQWSGEVAIASEQHVEVLQFVSLPPLTDGTIRNEFRSHPIDFVARRHLFRNGRWQPYAGGGARWVEGPSTPNTQFQSRASLQAVAGIDVYLTDRLAFRADARRLLRSDTVPYDRNSKFSFGLIWQLGQ